MNCHQLNFIVFIWELVNFSGIGTFISSPFFVVGENLYSGIVSEKTCALNKLFACLEGETCKQVTNSSSLGVCECKNKFKRIYPSGFCIEQTEPDHSTLPSPESVNSSGSTGSAAIGGVITVFLLIALAVGLAFAAKKYRWLHRVREKAQQMVPRGQYPVLVSQEDDPPLA